MADDPSTSRLLTILLFPAALAWDAALAVWRAWGRVALGLDRVLAGIMWPIERSADAMAWSIRTAGRLLRVATIVRVLSEAFDRALAPIERLLRRLALRLVAAVRRLAWFITDLIAPVTRPIARAASAVGRVARAAFQVAKRLLRALRMRLGRWLAPARRALRAALLVVRRRRR